MSRRLYLAFCAAFLVGAATTRPAAGQESACDRPVSLLGAEIDNHEPVFARCVNEAGVSLLATRRWLVGDEAFLLLVDPETLKTQIARAACWRCAETRDGEEAETRFLRAIEGPGKEPDTPKALVNMGLIHGQGSGSYLTGDLCPSSRPLDRSFLELVAKEGAATPIALSISGGWILHHAEDLDWLRNKIESGALAVSWVNHSYSHPFAKDRPKEETFLRTAGVDLDAEILETERLMLQHGLTPSVFFRFPGLISDASLMQKLRERHLVALGADSWIALGPPPRPGSIMLVHPNGNEPAGLKIFARLLQEKKVPKPLRPIENAPR
ncbi:MAG TPA: polysaccharide deacetylase [Methylocystis sp.]|nr:polysaccharide deacetylase [Methylocystis sp.]